MLKISFLTVIGPAGYLFYVKGTKLGAPFRFNVPRWVLLRYILPYHFIESEKLTIILSTIYRYTFMSILILPHNSLVTSSTFLGYIPSNHASHVKYIIPTNGSVCRKVRPVLPNIHMCAFHTYSYRHCHRVVLVKHIFLMVDNIAKVATKFPL